MSLHDPVKVLIIPVYDSYPALLQKHSLAGQIVIKILMLIGADVVWLNVGENTKSNTSPGYGEA